MEPAPLSLEDRSSGVGIISLANRPRANGHDYGVAAGAKSEIRMQPAPKRGTLSSLSRSLRAAWRLWCVLAHLFRHPGSNSRVSPRGKRCGKATRGREDWVVSVFVFSADCSCPMVATSGGPSAREGPSKSNEVTAKGRK